MNRVVKGEKKRLLFFFVIVLMTTGFVDWWVGKLDGSWGCSHTHTRPAISRFSFLSLFGAPGVLLVVMSLFLN